MRKEALDPLLDGRPARWQRFDFTAGVREDGTYRMSDDLVERMPAKVIVLEGAYASRPELADLVDLRVLIEVATAVRHERLCTRENSDWLNAWHSRGDVAEEYYFTRCALLPALIW